jgi:hypothetical protein
MRRFWMRDQFDHSVFAQTDLMAGYILNDNRAWDYSLKFQSLEVS